MDAVTQWSSELSSPTDFPSVPSGGERNFDSSPWYSLQPSLGLKSMLGARRRMPAVVCYFMTLHCRLSEDCRHPVARCWCLLAGVNSVPRGGKFLRMCTNHEPRACLFCPHDIPGTSVPQSLVFCCCLLLRIKDIVQRGASLSVSSYLEESLGRSLLTPEPSAFVQ